MADDGGDPALWCFWSTFGLRKTLNDLLAEGVTLRITTNSPKFQRTLWPKKTEWNNKIFEYIYTEVTR